MLLEIATPFLRLYCSIRLDSICDIVLVSCAKKRLEIKMKIKRINFWSVFVFSKIKHKNDRK
jgi:hypothetical protein